VIALGRALASALGLVLLTSASAGAAGAAEVRMLFPTDRLTQADPGQLTGRRVRLSLVNCFEAPSSCDEIGLLNGLDGWSVNPRMSLAFTAPIALDSVTPSSVFVLPLGDDVAAEPVGLSRLVWDAGTTTLYAKPERVLRQGRAHALVVTSRVRAGDGGPLRAPAGARAALDPRLANRLKALGIPASDVVASAVFTTQSVTAGLEWMRELIDARPAPRIRFALAPGSAKSVYARAGLESIVFTRQAATAGADRFAAPVALNLAAVPAAEVRTIAVGAFDSASFLSGSRHIPRGPSSKAPAVLGEERVHVTIFLPEGAMPAAGWPVVIFGHGFGNDRNAIPPLVAGTFARRGFATAAINVVGHGGGPEGTLAIKESGKEPVVLPAGGRGLDIDGDGTIGVTEGVETARRGPLALIANRDGLRQTVADLMQLARAIRSGVDVDGDGRPDLDGERIYYAGHSFGGIYGTLLMAVDSLPRAAVLTAPGAPIGEIARQAAVFRPLVIERLRMRVPALMNGEKDFVESLPLWGGAPVTGPAPGALAIQAYFDRAEWLQQGADPSAFAPYLKTAPLTAAGPRPVLFQMAVGDRTVPNPTTEQLIRAGDLQPFLSIYRHDTIVAGLPPRFANPHSFILWTGLAEVAAIARAAQEQIARFFLSDGRVIERNDERFDVPAAGSASR
jgi:dienelactone hydrolase